MTTLSKYKKEIKNMFFLSIEKELSEWESSHPSYHSKFYGDNKDYYYFIVEDGLEDFEDSKTIFLKTSASYPNKNKEKICRYSFWIFPIEFKVWWYVRKLKKHFRKVENDKKDMDKIEVFKKGLNVLNVSFQREVRKQKLDQINK